MAKLKNIITILALSAMVMSLNSCSVLSSALGTAYALSGMGNYEQYGPTPILVGENEYITPGVSEKIEYGISLADAQSELPSYVKITTPLRVYRDSRGCIGWVLKCKNMRNLRTEIYTVTKYGYVYRK